MAPPIVKRFLISLDENKWYGIFIFILVVGASALYAATPDPPPPRPNYKSQGQLSFSEPPPIFTSTGEQVQQQGRIITINTLLAPRVLEGVAKELNLDNKQMSEILEEKLKIRPPEAPSEDATGANPTGGPAPSPQLITIEYTDEESPQQAQLTLETFMGKMVDQSRWLNASQLRTRITSLEERLVQVKRDLTFAEEGYYKYISKQGTGLLAIQDGSLFNGITGSQQQQRELQVTIEGIDAEIKSLVDQLGLTPKEAYTSSALSADPIIANLRADIFINERELAIQSERLRSDHPTLKLLREQLRVNSKLLEERVKEVIGKDGLLTEMPIARIRQEINLDPARRELATRLVTLKTQRESLVRQLQSIKKTEQDLKRQYELYPTQQIEQARLVQAVDSQRLLYQTIVAALADAKSAEAETVSSLAIAQPASFPRISQEIISPKEPLLIMGGGAVFGLIIALGLVFLLASVDDRYHTPQELREAFVEREVPLLGQLPSIGGLLVSRNRTPILVDANPGYIPFYERVRSNIRRLGEVSKVVIITSIFDEEGKTLSAYNLAIASAMAGKRTLLVEADLRNPTKAKFLNLETTPGFQSEPLRFYDSRSDSITLVPDIENLYVLPSTGPQIQAAAILESSEFQRMLKDARGRFDMVIVDTPSITVCNDAFIIEPLTDGIVLVTRPGYTRKTAFSEAIDQFIEKKIPVIGAVINDVENLNVDNLGVVSNLVQEQNKQATSLNS